MKKQEKEILKLADGREVLYCNIGRDDEARRKNGFRVYISASDKYDCDEWIDIVEVFNSGGSIALPVVRVLEEKLWTKDLLTKVIQVLKQDGKSGKKLEYIIAKVAGAFKEKRLNLPNGHVLIGDLKFSFGYSASLPAAYCDLLIFGDVKDPKAEEIDECDLLEVKSLYTLNYPGTNIKSSFKKNKLVWCKGLESRIVEYLKNLAYFSRGDLSRQILEVADQLAFRSEWAVKCRRINQKLLSLNSKARNDERIIQAFALIKEVAGAGK